MITLVAAIGNNHVIGKDNKLLWHLPNDLKFFRRLTLDKTVIMGSNTLRSIGKPLPNRRNIVLSRSMEPTEGVEVFRDWWSLLNSCKHGEELFVIGGAYVYNQIQPWCNRMVLTHVDVSLDGDAYFPDWDETLWNVSELIEQQPDEKHKYGFTTREYRRKKIFFGE
jgi:dihydrofolate reductase